MTKGRAIRYSDDELAWLSDNRHLPRRESHAEFCRRFNRSISLENIKAAYNRRGWLTGRTGRYDKGTDPWNKGGKMPYNPNSAKTQFKKGNKPHNTNYEGHERLSKDGYIEISVPIKNKHTGFNRSYVLKHRWLWEKKHGPLPDGMCLKCLDGDKANTDPANWKPIPRALLPRLNGRFGRGYDDATAELKPAIMATVELEHSVLTIKRKRKIA